MLSTCFLGSTYYAAIAEKIDIYSWYVDRSTNKLYVANYPQNVGSFALSMQEEFILLYSFQTTKVNFECKPKTVPSEEYQLSVT